MRYDFEFGKANGFEFILPENHHDEFCKGMVRFHHRIQNALVNW